MTRPVQSTIDWRLLLNFRSEPNVAQAIIPSGFRPRVVRGSAVVGICMVKLSHIRPTGASRPFGLRSQNAAHRIAVEWDTDEGTEFGVYVPRRDTNSLVASLLGGRLIEGSLRHSRFDVDDSDGRISARVVGGDGLVIEVHGTETPELRSELFANLDEASGFFREGRVAYSPNHRRRTVEGIALDGPPWRGIPIDIDHVHSSFLSDRSHFASGSVTFDSALIVRHLDVEWTPAGDFSRAGTMERTSR